MPVTRVTKESQKGPTPNHWLYWIDFFIHSLPYIARKAARHCPKESALPSSRERSTRSISRSEFNDGSSGWHSGWHSSSHSGWHSSSHLAGADSMASSIRSFHLAYIQAGILHRSMAHQSISSGLHSFSIALFQAGILHRILAGINFSLAFSINPSINRFWLAFIIPKLLNQSLHRFSDCNSSSHSFWLGWLVWLIHMSEVRVVPNFTGVKHFVSSHKASIITYIMRYLSFYTIFIYFRYLTLDLFASKSYA